ncbi:hypothetical protein NXW05_02595 [Phocaeicola vulgatus]|nr:hypothetical protein [Phocaeicola vulgatus]
MGPVIIWPEEYGASSGRTGHNCGRSSRRRAESPDNVPASSRQCGPLEMEGKLVRRDATACS